MADHPVATAPLGALVGHWRTDGHVVGDDPVPIFDAGRATLELANPAQVAMIDAVEVGRRVSPKMRLALEVDDSAAATTRLAAAGAGVLAEPVETPWRSLNARLTTPDGRTS